VQRRERVRIDSKLQREDVQRGSTAKKRRKKPKNSKGKSRCEEMRRASRDLAGEGSYSLRAKLEKTKAGSI
jgi:hypothetical protein